MSRLFEGWAAVCLLTQVLVQDDYVNIDRFYAVWKERYGK
jgi:hypothetical protein